MKTIKLLLAMIIIWIMAISCQKDENSCSYQVNDSKINTYQVLGSHNSYRIRTFNPILQFMYANPGMLPEGFSPDDWDYTHIPMEDQMNTYGIRSLEIDVYYDPEGGLFFNRMGLFFLGMPIESGEPALMLPGLKVLHVPDIDYQTHVLTFKQALEQIKTWSESHRDHIPLIIQIEPKEDNLYAELGFPFTNTLPFNQTALESIDEEIKAVFGNELTGVITPDEVRKHFSNLNEAILNDAWPRLLYARGKVLFVMDCTGNEKADYLNGHPSLVGRTMFVYSEPGEPETAFLKYEDPRNYVAEIQHNVALGYMVRTRADADTKEARNGDISRREAAFSSGAQIISTDYYQPDHRGGLDPGWTTYSVSLPNAFIARPNPINGPQQIANCMISEE